MTVKFLRRMPAIFSRGIGDPVVSGPRNGPLSLVAVMVSFMRYRPMCSAVFSTKYHEIWCKVVRRYVENQKVADGRGRVKAA